MHAESIRISERLLIYVMTPRLKAIKQPQQQIVKYALRYVKKAPAFELPKLSKSVSK